MRKSTIGVGVLLGVAVLMALGWYMRSEGRAPIQEPFKISINSWVGWAPLYVAQERGLFGDVDVKLIRVEDTGVRKTTMISGEVDAYASSVDNFALDSAQGVPGKVILCFDESYGGDGIIVTEEISSIEDLRGRDVGYQKGLPSHFLLLTLLKRAGMSQSDVVHVDMDADKAGASFVAGHLDAAVTWEPWISKAASAPSGRVLITTRDLPGLIVDTLVVRTDVLADRRQAVQSVVDGWFAALKLIDAEPDRSATIMADAYGLELEEFKEILTGVRFYDLGRNESYFGRGGTGEIAEVFDSAGQLWREAGVIEQPRDAAQAIDASFIN